MKRFEDKLRARRLDAPDSAEDDYALISAEERDALADVVEEARKALNAHDHPQRRQEAHDAMDDLAGALERLDGAA